jgi:methanogenic corrinoid protein MtbC1
MPVRDDDHVTAAAGASGCTSVVSASLGAPPAGFALEIVLKVAGGGLRMRDASWPAIRLADIEAFCDALVDDDPRVCRDFIAGVQARGASQDALYIGYLAGAARHLGRMWEDDCTSFCDVTLGSSRLIQLLRELGPSFLSGGDGADWRGHAAFLAAVPGEHHTLGVVMAADYMRRAGWRVEVELGADADHLARVVRGGRFDVVGLSAGARSRLPELRRLVPRLREAAEPGAVVVVGGQIVELEPDVARQVGADASISDALSIDRVLRRLTAETRPVN